VELEIKYIVDTYKLCEPFPDILVFDNGFVTRGTSYFTSAYAPYTYVSNGDMMKISDEKFKEAKKLYYSSVDTSFLNDAKSNSPSEYISIEDIVDSLPNQA
jgi:hypothetical protein